MSLDAKKDWEDLKNSAVSGISDIFPIEGSKHVLDIKNVQVADNKDLHDYEGQLDTKMRGRTWSVPIKGEFRLLDKDTGRLIDHKVMTLGNLPKTTPRYSYIINGHEYQIDHLWSRKPGVYSRITEAGELESEFNLAKGRNFKLYFDPEKRDFKMKMGNTNIPLYPILKNFVDPKVLTKTWGKDVVESASRHKEDTALNNLGKALGGEYKTKDDIILKFLKSMEQTEMDPEVTSQTLGAAYDKVTPAVLLSASTKLLDISKGKTSPDDRESLAFKRLQGVDDKLRDRLGKNKIRVFSKIRNRLDKFTSVDDVIGSAFFDQFIDSQFQGGGSDGSMLSSAPDQTNPVDWLMNATKTTVLAPGEGGISSEHQIIDAVKAVDPSHLGFIDPLQTPESSRAGITLYLPTATIKREGNVYSRVFDKKGQGKLIDPMTFYKSTVALPDQVKLTSRGFQPKGSKIKASLPGNLINYVDWKKIDYVFGNPGAAFSIASNLVPFLNTNHGARVGMISRHYTQAIPLVERDIPLVQVSTGAEDKDISSWERVLGKNLAMVESHEAGEVLSSSPKQLVIKTKDGKVKKQLYHNFPLNEDGSFVSHDPLVGPGDKVHRGKIIADTNFTKNGILALGKNMRVGYLTIPGKTFEDGVVASQSAAEKLRAERLYRFVIDHGEDVINSRNKYQAYFPTAFKQSQLDKLETDGIVRKGQILSQGDPVSTSLEKTVPLSESKMIKKLSRSAIKPYRDAAIKWENEVSGKVVDIFKTGKKTTVLVKTTEPLRQGDKISNRFAAKGIVSAIIPDSEMPRDSEGSPLEVIFSPLSVPGRINSGQIYEALVGKVAAKIGKPIEVKNFDEDDYHAFVTDLLKKNKVKDTETLYDPSGRKLGDVLVGNGYILRLKHLVEDKYSERSGGPGSPYDVNRGPAGSSGEKAQALGSLEQYALLSHGARSILTDAHSRASDADQADEVWRALQLGLPLPPPKIPFVYKKFENYLKGLGVDINKKDNTVSLLPMTDKDVKEMSAGEIKTPETFRAKDLRPVPGGLFDPKVTKGIGGEGWGHYRLSESLPNPLFEDGIRALTGLSKAELLQVVKGEKGLPKPLTKTSALVVSPKEGLTGPQGLKQYMDSIDVKKEMRELLEWMPKLTGDALNKANKRFRVLRALDQTGMKPSDAYLMQNIPIIPPVMRPVIVKSDGNLSTDNLNELYRGIIITDKVYRDAKNVLPESQLGEIRGELYDGLAALTGISSKRRVQGDELKGILDTLAGQTPKTSFFQEQLIKRRQDLSGRAVIAPDPSLGLDEIAIPKKMAMSIYKPFVIRELGTLGYTPLKAQDLIKQNDPTAFAALHKVSQNMPILMKRDPVLHKYGIMAFKPQLHDGKDVRVSPIIVGPYGADFDGDAMALYSPISQKSIKEAWDMLPSKNLFSPATGRVAYAPTHEAVTGLFKMTYPARFTRKSFNNLDAAKKAFYSKEVDLGDVIDVGGVRSTLGRHILYDELPVKDKKLLTDLSFNLDKSGVNKFLASIGTSYPQYYSDVAKTLLNTGSQALYDTGFSLSLKDLEPDKKTRSKYLNPILRNIKNITPNKLVDLLGKASTAMAEEHKKKALKEGNSIYFMTMAGKPSWSQYQQLRLSPVMFTDMSGRAIPNPVAKSYTEGLDFGDYWHHSIGARKTIVGKVQEVSEPGYLTKRMVNTLIGTVVTDEDCKTTEGETLGIGNSDISDRFLAKPLTVAGKTFGIRSPITPADVAFMKKHGVKNVEVRSPLTCKKHEGICSRCYGLINNNSLPSIGDNIGIMAAQAIGEKSTQLTLSQRHTGGIYGGVGKTLSSFDRIEQLMTLPERIPNSAVLATTSGKVSRIEKDPVGGYNVYISDQRHYVPNNLEILPGIKKGFSVPKGMQISTGDVNPHELLSIAGIDAVRQHMTEELDELYSKEGIRRRNLEVITRGLTSLGVVTDPGDATQLVRGDVVPISKIKDLNTNLTSKAKYQAVLKGVDRAPHDLHEDWIARLNHMRLKDTILEAANKGLVSKVHSLNPIPSMARGDILDEGKEY